MASLLLFVLGVAGGLFSVAFLIGIAFVEPLAFVILAGICWGVWKWAGRGMENWWTNGYMQEEPIITTEDPVIGTSLDDDEEDYL